MKSGTRTASKLLLTLFMISVPAALASANWYVDGVNGNDNNDCLSSQTACQTIGHAIALCSSGDSIMVAPAIYTENLTIGIDLKIIGSDAATTIVDGNQAGSVFTISSAAHVRLSKLTIRNGSADVGGGINNGGTLTIKNSIVSENLATGQFGGGGIFSSSILTISNSIVSNNSGWVGGGIDVYLGTTTINKSTVTGNQAVGYYGGGVYNFNGTLAINKSTLTSNQAPQGGGIFNNGYAILTTITNSSISENTAAVGGGIFNWSTMTVNNSTLSGNTATEYGGGIFAFGAYGLENMTLQNTIVARSPSGGNCSTSYDAIITSNGYNLSSDNTCNFNGPGDMNNTDPLLGNLRDNGGPTQTMRLLPDSPALDAGNPSGCTDGNGNLLKTDQRGRARPGKYDTGSCDIGAFERQRDPM